MPKLKQGSRKSTLRDVALEAGVSVATVSRVLNNSTKVSAGTKERVGIAIEALSFAPSAAARSLNAGKTRTIGALVPTIDHSIFARYLNSLEGELSARGYGLVVAVTGGATDVEAAKAHDLLSLGVDGLIVCGVERSPEFDKAAVRFDVPVLITSYFDMNAAYPTIGYDNASIAKMAVDYLGTYGHQEIAVIHGPTDESDRTQARIDGAKSATSVARQRFFEAPLSVAGGAEAIQSILSEHSVGSLTAVLCLSDVQALGALFEALRHGLSIPDDLSIMGFDNLEWSAVSTPGLTTIELPAIEMGAAAAEGMVRLLVEGHPVMPRKIDAFIVERGSVQDLSRMRGSENS